MAWNFADGTRFFLGTEFGDAVDITGATNAAPTVLSATNMFVDGDEILVMSGWEDLTNTVYKPSEFTSDSITLGGTIPIDTTDENFYPPGGGAGTAQNVIQWVEIGQTLTVSSSGGDPKFVTIDPLAQRNSIQVPVGFNAQTLTFQIGYDPSLPGYQALVAASRTLQRRAFKFVMAGGQVGYGYGYVAANEMPNLTKGQVNQISASVSLLGKFVGYQS